MDASRHGNADDGTSAVSENNSIESPQSNADAPTRQADLKPHQLALQIPEMLRDEYVELVADIKKNGLHEPIVLLDGAILDGRHRYMACIELGIVPTTENFTGTQADAKAYVVSLNVHRRHLTLDQKRRIIESELRRDPAQSDRSIASKIKASPSTVGAVRKELEAMGAVSKLDTIVGRDGVKQPSSKPPRAPLTIDAEARHVSEPPDLPPVVVPIKAASPPPRPVLTAHKAQPFTAAASAGALIAIAKDLFVKMIWRPVPPHARIALRAALIALMEDLLRKEAGRR